MPAGDDEPKPAPFFRYAGGKRRLMPELLARLPEQFAGRYFEPFVGGGALLFGLDVAGSRCSINDAVPDIATAYEVLRDVPDELVAELHRLAWHPDEASYYAMRATDPTDPVKRAARTIYLNRLCFNGLYRQNRHGWFNTSYGNLKNPQVCDAPLLRADATRLGGVVITCGDFADAVASAQAGDFIYYDPPYLARSKTSSFVGYSGAGFGEADHRRLADSIDDLTERGVYVMLSNSDTARTRSIYGHSLHLVTVEVRRSIAATGGARRWDTEVIGTNYALVGSSTRR